MISYFATIRDDMFQIDLKASGVGECNLKKPFLCTDLHAFPVAVVLKD